MAEISLSEAQAKYGVPHKTLLTVITRSMQNMQAFRAHQVAGSHIWLFDDESQGFKSWLASYTPGRGRRPITATTPEQEYNQRYYQERKTSFQQSGKGADFGVKTS